MPIVCQKNFKQHIWTICNKNKQNLKLIQITSMEEKYSQYLREKCWHRSTRKSSECFAKFFKCYNQGTIISLPVDCFIFSHVLKPYKVERPFQRQNLDIFIPLNEHYLNPEVFLNIE